MPKMIKKKSGQIVEFDSSKIVSAVNKSAQRVMRKLTDGELDYICKKVETLCEDAVTPIETVHTYVEIALADVDEKVAKSYKDYRNYKTEFVHMLDKVYQKAQSIRYIGDRDNANTDSALVSTQRSLIYNALNSELYKKFFLSQEEREAMHDGYIYIHDRNARLDTMNCCIFDMANVLSGGFEMGNVWYNEPKTLDVAFDVIADVTMSAAAQQYGGQNRRSKTYLTIPMGVCL